MATTVKFDWACKNTIIHIIGLVDDLDIYCITMNGVSTCNNLRQRLLLHLIRCFCHFVTRFVVDQYSLVSHFNNLSGRVMSEDTSTFMLYKSLFSLAITEIM
ncbi:hypothetical protein ACF0H5_000538 [Mactra antiquata]